MEDGSDDEVTRDSQEDEDWMDDGWAQPVGSVPAATDRLTLDVVSGGTAPSTNENAVSNDNMMKRMLLNDNKAGMEGLDKEKINQIIFEASKGSKYFENEKNKEEQMKKRINVQMQKKRTISEAQYQRGVVEADRLLEDFEQQRVLSHSIVHIDMDAFYAAVEMRDKPELKDKPMAVGGTDMLSTSNYHARKFGVRAAMPGFIAKKLCPHLVIMPLSFDKYRDASKQVRSIMAEYDPNFCPMSLDEAYLDITDHLETRQWLTQRERTLICRDAKFVDSKSHCLCDMNEVIKNYGDTTISLVEKTEKLENYFWSKTAVIKHCDTEQIIDDKKDCSSDRDGGQVTTVCPNCGKEFPPFVLNTYGLSDEEAVTEMRMKIEQRTRLTASAGIAPNMMLAKVCSDRNKPNGQFKVPATVQAVMDFVRSLPTRKISGIGKVSEAMLNALDVYTCQDLYDKRGLLYHLYSPISFNYFMRICIGIGSTTVERDSERKSISTERTFSELSKPAELYQKCEELCDSLVEDLEEEHLKGKTVSIKIKTIKFEVKTRAHSLPTYTCDRNVIFQAASDLLRTEIQLCAPQALHLRLMGVRMSGLLHESLCKEHKQNTILNAFKKMSDKLAGTRKVPPSPCKGLAGTSTVPPTSCKVPLPALPNLEKLYEDIATVQNLSKCSDGGVDLRTDQLKSVGGMVHTSVAIPKFVEKVEDVDIKKPHLGDKVEDTSAPFPKCVGSETTVCINELTTDYVETHCDIDSNVSTSVEKLPDDQINVADIKLEDKSSDSCSSQEEQLLKESILSSTDRGCIELKDSPIVGVGKVKRQSEVEEPYYINGSDSIDSWEGNLEYKKQSTGSKNQSIEIKSAMNINQNAASKEHNSESKIQCIDHKTPIKQGENSSSLVSDNDGGPRNISASIALPGSVATPIGNKDTNPIDTRLLAVRATRSGLVRNTKVSKRKSKGKLRYTCPICSQEIFCSNLTEFNTHVDDCLEGSENMEGSKKTSINCNTAMSECGVSQMSDCDTTIGPIPDVNDDQYTCTTVNKSGETCNIEYGVEHSKGTESCERHPRKSVFRKDDTVSKNDQNSCDIAPDIKCQNSLKLNGNQTSTCDDATTEQHEYRKLLPDSPESSSVHPTTDCCSLEVDDKNIAAGVFDRDSASKNDLDTLESTRPECSVSRESIESDTINSMNIQSTISGGICEPTGQGYDGGGTQDKMQASNMGYESNEDNTSDVMKESNIDNESNEDNIGIEMDEESSLLVCPVCNVEQRSCSLADFNSHVDLCLSRGAISSILREDRSKDMPKIKRSHSSINTPQSSKRRKTTTPNGAPPSRSILSFFKGNGGSS